ARAAGNAASLRDDREPRRRARLLLVPTLDPRRPFGRPARALAWTSLFGHRPAALGRTASRPRQGGGRRVAPPQGRPAGRSRVGRHAATSAALGPPDAALRVRGRPG